MLIMCSVETSEQVANSALIYLKKNFLQNLLPFRDLDIAILQFAKSAVFFLP